MTTTPEVDVPRCTGCGCHHRHDRSVITMPGCVLCRYCFGPFLDDIDTGCAEDCPEDCWADHAGEQ